jgi:carbohydrate-binding DOMON domain-containing protein
MALLFLLLLSFSLTAQEIYFQMEDSAGDEGVEYPTAPFFSPGQGYFDLLSFQVSGDGKRLAFDFEFARVANPWQAPEGFSHQLIDLYLDTAPGGKTETRLEGAGVSFDPEHGWEHQLRLMPWGGSALYGSRGSSPVEVSLLPDGKTIRAQVAQELLGSPRPDWGYYLLVGSYDGFGPDNYRQIQRRAGPWNFGGERAGAVIDFLAPDSQGRLSQEALLQPPSVLFPMGVKFNSRPKILVWLTVCFLALFTALELYRLRLRSAQKKT